MHFTDCYEHNPANLTSKMRWYKFNMLRAYHQSSFEKVLKYAEFNTIRMHPHIIMSFWGFLEAKREEGTQLDTLKTCNKIS